MSLIETIAGVAIVSLTVAAALGATLVGARVAGTPVARDLALLSARNAAVEARAAAAYDPAAASAMLGAPAAAWRAGGVQLTSAVDGGAIVITATSGAQSVSVRYPVVQEALPQGTIVDLDGNAVSP